ncbi:helix-turn-helix domain-containing protein [Vallitalea guaymasensis]|uniref:Helix-turn-helix transcriptional regulator n=1 Tax=Vallitalea guaymasensis TaxID=1185412 RepID=A0A8J8M8Z8_9FIRM|nr:helix-turn-helix transcriptional regulator [Vallitalea guaymasensis]QUH28576.1 helix-turn-helix transcriptional regulator [Vallitalea guaymasensis]
MIFPRVRHLREDLDLKQKDIASIIGIDQSTYSDYETGKLNIPIETFIKLADYYNTSIDFLVGRTDKK